ncbi:MAG: hypothetical protein ACK42L_03815 [Thermoanaerobaculum sp.]
MGAKGSWHAGGRHRSVYLASRLGEDLRHAGWFVRVHHRDRDREA